MNDLLFSFIEVFGEGLLIGLLFFTSLWWTIRIGVTTAHPLRFFLLGTLFRTALGLSALYFLVGSDWKRLLFALLGFLAARLLVTRLLFQGLYES